MAHAPLDAGRVDEWEAMIDINIKGVLYGIAAALPVFRRQNAGHFINLSSVGGLKVSPGGAVYCATKFAVSALSEGLRQEVGPTIRITAILPGAIDSELKFGSGDAAIRAAIEGFYECFAIPADSVARAIAYAIEQPPEVDINQIVLRPTAQEF